MLTWTLDPVLVFPGRTLPPVGAQATRDGVTYRVWAPDHQRVRVVVGRPEFDTRYVPLERDAEGFFTGRDENGRAGDLYWFQLGEHESALIPDPASRFQPEGVEGASQVVAAHEFRWQANHWRRPPLRGRVIYELHLGTFTPEGTFRAAVERLDALADLGVNTLEIMPVADFAGRWNWGYDGVMLFAPSRAYGTPDDFRALIDAAHARGLAVILDVVYNHLGPVGNVLPRLARAYFDRGGGTPWGQGLNFSGPDARPVREFFLQNACYWLDEFRIDGLRLDAVHAIEDESASPIVAEIAAAVHARGGFVIAEDERNDARIITPREEGGWGVDGMWSDDFHHVMRVALTREQHAHFANYTGALDEWIDTLREGWFYHGQFFSGWKRPRGSSGLQLAPEKFVWCISNHDQVGNRPLGDRLNAVVSPEAYRAVSMLLCLAPFTPLLFMGQEWGATTPFPFFTDHPGEIGERMAENRTREFRERAAHYDAALLARMPDPQAEETFAGAKLQWAERETGAHAMVFALYRECLRLRAREAMFQSAARSEWTVEQRGESIIELRWAAGLRLVFSLKKGAVLAPREAPGEKWELVLSSNEARFGGSEEGKVRGPGAALWRSE